MFEYAVIAVCLDTTALGHTQHRGDINSFSPENGTNSLVGNTLSAVIVAMTKACWALHTATRDDEAHYVTIWERPTDWESRRATEIAAWEREHA